ncbi:MAG: hypothetical protein QG632_673 [Candidatus Dependentiae bacterium]|nr:hypothetical protein [Candidatus Dependentiae bacterium]
MWKQIFTKTYPDVKKEAVWRLWTDINNWPRWHDDLVSCVLQGPFAVGNHFMLQPKGMKPIKIDITEVNELSSFTDGTSFFGAKMYNTHALEEAAEGLKITNTLVVTGPLRWVWIKLVAQGVAASFPTETEALIQQARGIHD